MTTTNDVVESEVRIPMYDLGRGGLSSFLAEAEELITRDAPQGHEDRRGGNSPRADLLLRLDYSVRAPMC